MTGRRARLLAVGAVLGLGTALAACSDGLIVASSSQQLYLKVPSGWTVFGPGTLAQDGAFGALFTSPPIFASVASADPHARPGEAFTASAYPWAIVVVRPLSSTEQSEMSLNGLRDVLMNIDSLQADGSTVEPLATPTLLVNGPLHGSLVAYELQGSQGSPALAYEQKTWVNSATDKVWVLMSGCSPECFQAQEPVIDRLVKSFLVLDKGGK
jgi:hypothetical protein